MSNEAITIKAEDFVQIKESWSDLLDVVLNLNSLKSNETNVVG